LVNCPNCGFSVTAPVKTWPIPSRKPPRESEETKLAGIFECPSCKARFRSAVDAEMRSQETINIKDMVGRVRTVKEGLMQTLVNLREKIKTLETERANLMVEIENLRRVAELRADALENEVIKLREEVKSFRDLLDCIREEE
jgi:predicted  nucleic acid-binding Zn-ribbon protein